MGVHRVPWLVVAGTVAVGLAAVGTIAVAGPLAAVVLATLAAASPLALRWCLEHFTSRSTVAGAAYTEPPRMDDDQRAVPVWLSPPFDVADPDSMTDEQLCLAWRGSFIALHQTQDTAGRVRLVEARAGYLDELERRHPAGFARWMAGGARAASDPARYVHQAPDRSRKHDA